ncbi:MAG: terminase family protein [Opitutales bacterium]|nr:terminase family protein [Opitutales bacterium]
MKGEKQTFFLPYQKRWILDNSRLKILEKSRQIGMTMATSYRLVSMHVSRVSRQDSWVSSRDELQAKLFVNDCKNFITLFQRIADIYGVDLIDHSGRTSSFSLTFANGSSINSLSSSPDAQAGKRGTRVLDEFALHTDPKQLFVTSLPGITWGGQLEILSTHRGSNNFFNQLITEIRENGNPKHFSYHRVTLEDVLEQGFLERLQSKLSDDDPRKTMSKSDYFDYIRSECPDEESFLQEYMCCPSDDHSAFLSYDLITPCEYSAEDDWECLPNKFCELTGDCYIGVDIGRDHDLTVMWLLEKKQDMLYTRSIICLKNETFSRQEQVLQMFKKIPALCRICIDCTGIGRQFYERACESFGRYIVEGVTFTNGCKEQLAYSTRAVFENGGIRIPNDDFVRADLRAIKRETTFAGNIRFSADRTRNGHADRFWALALAVHACSGAYDSNGLQFFESIERGQNTRKVRYFNI